MAQTTKPFDMANSLEVPAAFREFAEKGAAQSKEWLERMRATADETTNVLENAFRTGSTGAAEYNRKLLETARTNANATFDHWMALLGTKSVNEAIEVSTHHVRKQFDALAEQTKELSALAQKVTKETAEPVQAGLSKAFKKVA